MRSSRLLRLSNLFYVLASSEELPKDSSELSAILKNIGQLETYTARKEYAEKNLEHLSSGSSRIVYRSPKDTIIKLAKNDKGIAQNKAEANPEMKSKYLNEILGHADNYSWIQTHYLDKITVKDFQEMTGLKFDDFGDSIRYGLKDVSGNTDLSKPKNFDKVKESDIYKEIHRIGEKFKLMPGDLARISSWGTKDGRPILIDAGLTSSIYSEYYEDSSS